MVNDFFGKVECAAAQNVVGRDAHDEEGAEDEGAEEDVDGAGACSTG